VTEHFADRLLQSIADKGAPVCVGIDPVLERLPAPIRNAAPDEARALLQFGSEVVRIVAPLVPAVKINTAFFERYGGAGVDAYFELVAVAGACGLAVIGDCKRGDVGHTAEQYAAGQFEPPAGRRGPDAVTLQSYLGWDAIQPFCSAAERQGRGLFILVQTSNPSAAAVQDFPGADGRTLSEHVAALVESWAAQPGRLGRRGYSLVGAVVAPRDAALARRLRLAMPSCLFLVPGYGAQGAGAEEVRTCFKPDGSGALVNASRSVIHPQDVSGSAGGGWQAAVESACRRFVQDIARATGR
jgi:orotidine-5'-phosphate decarboxylase